MLSSQTPVHFQYGALNGFLDPEGGDSLDDYSDSEAGPPPDILASMNDPRYQYPPQEFIPQKPKIHKGFKDVKIDLTEHFMFLGQTKSGKTTAIRNLLIHIADHYNIAAVWLFSDKFDKEPWLRPGKAHQEINKEMIEEIWRISKRIKKKRGNSWVTIVILDDVMGENFGGDNETKDFWAKLISTCREDNLVLIFSVQYLKKLTPVIRNNVHKYIVCHANKDTVDSLVGLSSCDTKDFRSYFRNSVLLKGKPMVFDVVPGAVELMQVEMENIDAESMPSLGF